MMRLRPVNNALAADIVIGNPPFGNRNNQLWGSISNQEIVLLKDSAVIAFITPQNFIYQTCKIGVGAEAYEMKVNFLKNKHEINLDLKKYFVNVGSTFCGWVLQKEPAIKNELSFSCNLGRLIKKIITHGETTRRVARDSSNCTYNQKSSHSEIETDEFPYKFRAGKKVKYSKIKGKYYYEKKVLGSKTGCPFSVGVNVGVDHNGVMYFRKGYENELCHAYNSDLISKKFLRLLRGSSISSPLMQQLPNFSDETLLRIRKVITDAGENVEAETKKFPKELNDEINKIVKDELCITDEDEKLLSGK